MQHNSRGGGGGGGEGMGGLFSGPPALSLFSKDGTACCDPGKEYQNDFRPKSDQQLTSSCNIHSLPNIPVGDKNKEKTQMTKQWICSRCTSNSHCNFSNSFNSSSLNKDGTGLDNSPQRNFFNYIS